MKLYHRIASLLTLVGMLLGIAVLGTSCVPEFVVDLFWERMEDTTPQTRMTETVEISAEEQTSSGEPDTLPGEDTLAPDCDHRYEEWIVAIDPQCEIEGLAYRLCQACGGRQEKSVAATGHTEEPKPDVPPTCSLEGSMGGTHCAVCYTVMQQPTVVPVIDHTFQSGICVSCGVMEDGADGLAYLDLYNQSYGYDYLGTMLNGDARQQFYGIMDEAVRLFHSDPSLNGKKELKDYDPVVTKINYAELGLTTEEAYAIWKTYRDDNPLYYWLSNMVVSDSRTLYLLLEPEYTDGIVRMETNALLYQNISEYLAQIPADATAYQTALLFHDRMINSIDYALTSSGQPQTEAWAHSILGVFDGRGAVCEGFARAYQLLLNFKGVDCLLVTGESREQGHAWNMIKLGDEWFGVDVTWDDNNESSNPYAYFCLSEQEFYQSHVLDLHTDSGVDFLYEVPKLSQYSIEWVDLYQGDALIGRYICIDRAFEAMTDATGVYTVRLLDGKGDALLHDVTRFHIYGDLPTVGGLTLIGKHTIKNESFFWQSYTATEVCLERNVTLHSQLTLKSLFLISEKNVTVKRNGFTFTHGDYSALQNYVREIA